MEVESHDGTAYLPQAEMVYNGLGQRLEMTAYAGGLSLTTQYVLDSEGGAAPLIATANSESTYYLYGLGAAAERAAGWSYYLHDGLGSLRKVVDADAGVTLERSYTPWGDVLSQSGSINPAQGYMGGWVDAATGLIYVGNGQYYDPQTGRFLTRDAQPGKFNPYVPGADPIGLLIGPMALLVLARGRKGKKGSQKVDLVLLATMTLLLGGLSLTACSGDGEVIPPTLPPGATWTLTPTSTSTTTPTQTQAPTVTPTQTATCTLTSTPTSGNWEYVGRFRPSAYNINIEEDFLGGKMVPIPAVDKEGLLPGLYLSSTGYGHYNYLAGAQYANENFLYSYAAVCQQGSGKLAVSGDPITCTTPVRWSGIASESQRKQIKFDWGSKDRINNMRSFDTVAVCPMYKGGVIPHPTLDNKLNLTGPRTKLLLTGKGIEEYFLAHGASDSIVTVIDVGEGLCEENKIDIYIGEGLAALAFGYDDLVNGTSSGSITTEMDVYKEK